jgi:hypothetical protein
MAANDIELAFKKFMSGDSPIVSKMIPYDRLSSEIEQEIIRRIPDIRTFLLENFIGKNKSDDYYKKKGYYPGSRFNSDSGVIWLIAGGSTGDDEYFKKWTYEEMIISALITSASSDCWYEFEKVWF